MADEVEVEDTEAIAQEMLAETEAKAEAKGQKFQSHEPGDLKEALRNLGRMGPDKSVKPMEPQRSAPKPLTITQKEMEAARPTSEEPLTSRQKGLEAELDRLRNLPPQDKSE